MKAMVIEYESCRREIEAMKRFQTCDSLTPTEKILMTAYCSLNEDGKAQLRSAAYDLAYISDKQKERRNSGGDMEKEYARQEATSAMGPDPREWRAALRVVGKDCGTEGIGLWTIIYYRNAAGEKTTLDDIEIIDAIDEPEEIRKWTLELVKAGHLVMDDTGELTAVMK